MLQAENCELYAAAGRNIDKAEDLIKGNMRRYNLFHSCSCLAGSLLSIISICILALFLAGFGTEPPAEQPSDMQTDMQQAKTAFQTDATDAASQITSDHSRKEKRKIIIDTDTGADDAYMKK